MHVKKKIWGDKGKPKFLYHLTPPSLGGIHAQMWIHIDMKTKENECGYQTTLSVLPKKKRIKFGNLHMYAAFRKPSLKRVIPLANHHLVLCLAADGGTMGIPCRLDCGGGGGTPDNIGTRKGTQTYWSWCWWDVNGVVARCWYVGGEKTFVGFIMVFSELVPVPKKKFFSSHVRL